MAPDRRFGLPHPLDDDPSEDSSAARKPGIWESLRRALGSPPAASSPVPAIERREPPLPAAPRRPEPIPDRAMPAPPVTPTSEALPAAPPPRPALDASVPFLEDPPVAPAEQPSPAREEAPAHRPPEPAPRLARGLDSFSRSNAEREKRFAHLLHDGPPGGKKPRGPGGGG